jgi:hypothetical protein
MTRMLYTKSGIPISESGGDLFDASGRQVGRLRGDKVYGPDGKYVATLDGGRLVYRSTDRATISSPFAPRQVAGFAVASVVGVAIWGDGPRFGSK